MRSGAPGPAFSVLPIAVFSVRTIAAALESDEI